MGAIDRKRYAGTLATFQPEAIEMKAQYQEALAAVEELMDAGDKRTPEQTAVYLLLAQAGDGLRRQSDRGPARLPTGRSVSVSSGKAWVQADRPGSHLHVAWLCLGYSQGKTADRRTLCQSAWKVL